MMNALVLAKFQEVDKDLDKVKALLREESWKSALYHLGAVAIGVGQAYVVKEFSDSEKSS